MNCIEKFSAPIFENSDLFKEYVIRKHEPTGLLFASILGESYGVILQKHQHPKAEEFNKNLKKIKALTYVI